MHSSGIDWICAHNTYTVYSTRFPPLSLWMTWNFVFFSLPLPHALFSHIFLCICWSVLSYISNTLQFVRLGVFSKSSIFLFARIKPSGCSLAIHFSPWYFLLYQRYCSTNGLLFLFFKPLYWLLIWPLYGPLLVNMTMLFLCNIQRKFSEMFPNLQATHFTLAFPYSHPFKFFFFYSIIGRTTEWM